MTDELDALLESMDPTDPATWAVLADWHLERGLTPGPTALPTVANVRAAVRWRLGFVTLATLEFDPAAKPGLYELQPLLRSRALRLTTELRVGARFEPRTRVFGGPAAQPPAAPPRLTARALDAVLASAPPALATLVVWSTTDATDVAALEPLTRLRPLSATRLMLRADAGVLLDLLDHVAQRRWRTLTLRSQWHERDLRRFDQLAARHPDVQFELVTTSARRTPNDTWRGDRQELHLEAEDPSAIRGGGAPRGPNLRWVADPDPLCVSSAGSSFALTPESPMPPALVSALHAVGVTLRRRHGTYALVRDAQLTEAGTVLVDGVPLVEPRLLGPGDELDVRVDDPGRPLPPIPGAAPGGAMMFGNVGWRRHQARFSFSPSKPTP